MTKEYCPVCDEHYTAGWAKHHLEEKHQRLARIQLEKEREQKETRDNGSIDSRRY